MEARYYSIQKLQAGLSLLGYDVGKIDGDTGQNTNTQIRKFLKDNKISGVDPSNIDAVLEKVRLKTLADPKAQERLAEMAKNPASLSPEGVKVLQGGLALKDIRIGAGHERVAIDGVAGPLTMEASARLLTSRLQAWKENHQEISRPAATTRTVGLTGDNRTVAERRADYYLDTVVPQYAARKHGESSPFPPNDKKAAAKKEEIRAEIVKYESLTLTAQDAQRALGYNKPGTNPDVKAKDLENRIANARTKKGISEEDAVIKGTEDHIRAVNGYGEYPVLDRVEQGLRNFKFQEKYGRPDRISELTGAPEWARYKLQDYHYVRYGVVANVRESMQPDPWDRILDGVRNLLPVAATAAPLPSAKGNWGTDQLIDERQHPQARAELVDTILPDAAKATGVPVDYMRAVWGAESGFSRDIVSKSGCMGSWQFEKRTFAAVLGKYGDKIAADLRAKGLDNLADKVELHAHEMKGLGNVWEAPGSKITNEEMQAMRFDPRINTLAAGYLNADNARSLKINLNDRATWGTGYSAYNLGVGSTKTLRSEHWRDNPHVMGQIKAAVTNDTFFINPLTGLMDATGRQVLGNYEVRMLAKEREYGMKFGPSAQAKQPLSYASSQDGPRENRESATSPFRDAALNVTADTRTPQSAIMGLFQNAKTEMTQRVFAQPPAPVFTPSGPV